MLPKLFFATLLFLSTALSAQTPTADTTIAGQTLPLLPIETLIAQLQRPANGPALSMGLLTPTAPSEKHLSNPLMDTIRHSLRRLRTALSDCPLWHGYCRTRTESRLLVVFSPSFIFPRGVQP